jgi:hypothetical protein
LAKAKPGAIGFASSGIGTYGHFAGELLKISSGADLMHVPYRGSGPALNDIAAGHVPLMMAGELVELAKAGKVRILATTNERRWFELPDVPTMKESGFPQFTAHSWIGLAGPAGMNPEIVAKLNAAGGQGAGRSEGAGPAQDARRPAELLKPGRVRCAHRRRSRRLCRDRRQGEPHIPVGERRTIGRAGDLPGRCSRRPADGFPAMPPGSLSSPLFARLPRMERRPCRWLCVSRI